MNRLTIISDTVDHGQAFGTLVLGLSSPQFRVVTCIEDTNKVPNEGFIIHDDHHPVNSIELRTILTRCGAKNLRDKEYLRLILNRMYHIFSMEYELRKGSNTEYTTSYGIANIKRQLEDLQLNEEMGIKFIYGRDEKLLYFYISPASPLAEVIYNLYRGYVTKLNPEVKLTNSIQINDPKGIFKQKSINYGW